MGSSSWPSTPCGPNASWNYRRETAALFEEVDVVVAPATPLVAPEIGTAFVEFDGRSEAAGNALTRFTTFFDMTGNPALSVLCGLHSTGLPMGVQFVGRPFEEAAILGVGQAVERAGRFRVPPPKL